MSRTTTLVFGAIIFAAALGAAVMFSGRGIPEPTESAPANVPAAPAR
ncbi:MAG: hypothetical protein AB1698_15910 [Pseudomonadota bacterium]